MRTDKTRVLLVDDSAVLRRLAAVTLTSLGLYDVDEARDAFEALELMLTNDYGAILTDYYMPGIDGIEFVRRVRRMDQWSHTPVVMISTERDPYVERVAKDAGVDDFLVKPFEPGLMREVLGRLIGRASAQGTTLTIDAQSIIDSMPYPVMVLDERHNVILGNSAFWRETGAGMDDRGIVCTDVMHADGTMPVGCPLAEAVRTGAAAETVIGENGSATLVSVYPMDLMGSAGEPLFLHIARPLR